MSFNSVSFWFDTCQEQIQPRPALTTDIEVDVAIIGAGYTGLWTAYYLKQQQPTLSIAIVESETAGFGASGRNGGWLMGAIEGQGKYLAELPADERSKGFDLIFGIIDEVAKVSSRERIDCDLQRGGSIYAAARYPEQIAFMQDFLKHQHSLGLGEEDYRWLNRKELEQQIRIRNGYGGVYSPHCGVINPAKLARGLARSVEGKGVQIFEQSPVINVENRCLKTAQGSIKANVIVPATEGFSAELMNIKQYVLPVQSLIIATEPLNSAQWAEIGMEQRPAFSDAGRLTTYGQRSADGRMIFGARGGYIFGGKVRHQFNLQDPEFRFHEQLLRDLFPSLQKTKITHGWGGTLGMARNNSPFALFDSATGIASAGGYGGEGVGASNLFGRTLADLILQRDSELTRMPWAFQQATHQQTLQRWEPEPLRWLAYKTILQCFSWEDDLYSKQNAAVWKKKLAGMLCSKLALLVE